MDVDWRGNISTQLSAAGLVPQHVSANELSQVVGAFVKHVESDLRQQQKQEQKAEKRRMLKAAKAANERKAQKRRKLQQLRTGTSSQDDQAVSDLTSLFSLSAAKKRRETAAAEEPEITCFTCHSSDHRTYECPEDNDL